MSDYGIKVSRDGVDVNDATGEDVFLNMQYPLHKLDVTNEVSFQNILITFANNPPAPDGVTSFMRETEIYKFKHNYTYIPATWLLYQNLTPNSAGSIPYGMFASQIASESAFSAAVFYYYVDSTYVRLIVRQNYQSGFGTPTDITGYRLRLRVYVFAEDVGVS